MGPPVPVIGKRAKKTLSDARLLQPEQLKIDFETIYKATAEQDAKFFELHLSQIFVDIWAFANRVSGDQNLDHVYHPWRLPFLDEFVKYAEDVARPGPGDTGTWDDLLYNGQQRVCMISGILMKALEVHVFSSMLFGAEPSHLETLQDQDVSFRNLEGFKRRELRTQSNKTYLLTRQKAPPMFWGEVDRVTLQLLSMLLPLYNIAGEAYSRQVTPFEELYTDLHDLVAYAGWVNIALQVSDSIVSFDWEKPGDHFTIHQVNLHHGIYEYSRVRTEQQFQKTGRKAQDHLARVKISAVPEITHFTASKAAGNESRTSIRLLRPHVVYYEGLADEKLDYESHPSLAKHIRQEKGAKARDQQFILSLVLVFLLYWYFVSENDAFRSIAQKASLYTRISLPRALNATQT